MERAFALVEFRQDKKRVVVPVKDIKNFKPQSLDDFIKRKIYKTLWPSEHDESNLAKYDRKYYESMILCLGASRESINTEKRFSAVPGHLLLSASDTLESDWERAAIGQESMQMKKDDLLKTMEERTKNIKNSSHPSVLNVLCISPSNSVEIETNSESSQDDIVPKRILDETKQKLETVKKKLRTEKDANNVLKKENEILRTEKSELENKLQDMTASMERIHNLNLQYQEDMFKNISENQNRHSNSVQMEDPTMVPTVSLGSMQMRKETWDRIKNCRKHSIFVKELAVAFWDKETLATRSVTGKPSPFGQKYGDERRYDPLTPEKMGTIRELFVDRQMERGMGRKEAEDNVTLVNRWVGEKIGDLRKAKRKISHDINENII